MSPAVSLTRELHSKHRTLTLPPSWAGGSLATGQCFFMISELLFNAKPYKTNIHNSLLRGGIMFWADNLGSKYICSKMETWAKKYGDFYKPCAYLAERAAKGASLVRISSFLLRLTDLKSPSDNDKTWCREPQWNRQILGYKAIDIPIFCLNVFLWRVHF